MAAPSPYSGSTRKLVLAFDVGTTYSGISYSILNPGQIPEAKGVTKFPSQEHVHGSSKIPSVIYYDENGAIRAIGAETLSEGVFERAEEEGWIKVEWFKMHLRPRAIRDRDNQLKSLPPLPADKTAVQVLADYLEYLFRCARAYIVETQPNGEDFWASIEATIDFVLSHPNGWEGLQQTQMRSAAILAGLVSDTPAGNARISFVTEGEASLHFAIQHGLPDGVSKGNEGVVIVDAGGGTIDISAYVRRPHPFKQIFEEISVPQCFLHGSICVSDKLREHLKDLLQESDFLDDLDHIVDSFDRGAKLRFRSDKDPQFIKFGAARDNDPAVNIRFGQLKLTGAEVAAYFQPSVDCIIDAVINHSTNPAAQVKHIVLVGGFAASDWLYQCTHNVLSKLGYIVLRPDYYVNKAVADGAINFYLGHNVHARRSKTAIGADIGIDFDTRYPGHAQRERLTYLDAAGRRRITVFWTLLHKNKTITQASEIRQSFEWTRSNLNQFLGQQQVEIFAYRGIPFGNSDKLFMDGEDADMFSTLCHVQVDVSHLIGTPNVQRLRGLTGEYFSMNFDVVLLVGGVELKVLLAWQENGVERRSPAKVLYIE